VLTVRDNELGVGGIGDASSELAGGRGKALWLVGTDPEFQRLEMQGKS
jgi:hypothetical protein